MAKKQKILVGLGAVALVGGVVMGVTPMLLPEETRAELSFPKIPSTVPVEGAVYSNLTGLALASEAERTAPAYCVQTPNGIDGSRPQVGLDEAGVVFEAIAEAGITRFAAIYQAPRSAVIGPVRSLRIYYLQWDTPFDCAIVHAGGADDAIRAVQSGGYYDLSENYAYMYRGTYGGRLWNNLFTTGAYLAQYSQDAGMSGSEIKGFTRLTPAEAMRARVDATASSPLVITEPAEGNTSALAAEVGEVAINFGGYMDYNVRYTYDATNGTYARSYETGAAHEVYACPNENLGEVNPESYCELRQLTPTVVVAMVVREQRAAYDGYHEDITTIGSGEVYVFQNGTVVRGRWEKPSAQEQIRFYDATGAEIALVPGQTFVEAVPQYGSVRY